MKHKHCDLIKAWADGADIQCWDKYTSAHGVWRDICGKDVNWNPEIEYRIKPEDKFIKYKVGLFTFGNDKLMAMVRESDRYSQTEKEIHFIKWILDEQTVDVGWFDFNKREGD